MLSFQREQNMPGSSANQAAVSDPNGAKTPTSPDDGYIEVKNTRQSLRKSTILLVLLVGIGLTGLWFMVRKSRPQAASAAEAPAEEKQIEEAISRLMGVSSQMESRMDEIVNKFYEFSDVLQVNVDELVKNPFELELMLAGLRDRLADPGEKQIDLRMIRRQQMEAELKRRTKDLQLLSIMRSEKGRCCMLEDQLLHEGDSLEGLLVKQIGDSYVVLTLEPGPNGPVVSTGLEDLKVILKLTQ